MNNNCNKLQLYMPQFHFKFLSYGIYITMYSFYMFNGCVFHVAIQA